MRPALSSVIVRVISGNSGRPRRSMAVRGDPAASRLSRFSRPPRRLSVKS